MVWINCWKQLTIGFSDKMERLAILEFYGAFFSRRFAIKRELWEEIGKVMNWETRKAVNKWNKLK